MSRCWRYVGGKCLAGDGGKRAVLRGEHEVSRKVIAQGRPECSRCPVCSCAVLFAQIARETAGAASTRSSLRPLIEAGGKLSSKPRAISAARMRNYIHPSLRAQRSNPCRGTKKARHKERMDCFAALAMTRREPSSSVGSFDYEDSACCRLT